MSSAKRAAATTPDAARAIDQVCALGTRLLESGEIETLQTRPIQQLVRLAVKLYMAKRESGCEFSPVDEGDLTATDVSVTASGLLQAARLEPFELTLWAKFGQL